MSTTNKTNFFNKPSNIKGFKVFSSNWTIFGEQYEVGGTYETDNYPEIFVCGYIFYYKLEYVSSHDYFGPEYKYAEVEILGDIADDPSFKEARTNKFRIIREIPWQEVLDTVNDGRYNTGVLNTGNYNTGNKNTGSRNSGKGNEGHHNSEDYNKGNYNTGYSNTGDYNSGTHNQGDYNTGNLNTGDCNTGANNQGDYNTGNANTGDCNTGNYNTGSYNTGSSNIGFGNTGDKNQGDYNVGDYNVGDYNVGDYNIGDYNIGDFNSCSYCVGCFNTVNNPKIYLFNKPSDWTLEDWLESDAAEIISDILYECKEKDRQTRWDKLSDEKKSVVKALPNFDPEIFKQMTGITVN